MAEGFASGVITSAMSLFGLVSNIPSLLQSVVTGLPTSFSTLLFGALGIVIAFRVLSLIL